MTGIDIDFYCRAYDDVLSPKDCEDYIDKYNETLRVDNEKWKNISVCFKDSGEKNISCGGCNCDRLGPMEYDRFSELNEKLIDVWHGAVRRYIKDCNIDRVQSPENLGWE